MDKSKAQVTEGVVSVIVNAALFALKFWAGIVTGSIAVVADAWHTLSDSLTSIFVILAAKLSAKKADREHPFGHGRWEHISSLFVAFILGIVAYDFFRNSLARFIRRETVNYGAAAIAVTVASIVVKEALSQYAFYIGRKTGNALVKADGWHHRSDALSSVIVLAGILLGVFFGERLWWIDSVLGILVALAIFYVSVKIMKEAVTKLLGEEPGKELIEQITGRVAASLGNDPRLHHFHIHNYVIHKELTLHARLDRNMSIEKGHRVISEIEEMILNDFGIIATIHLEPLQDRD